MSPVKLHFETLNAALKAAGEATRLRILALLGEAELTVSDLTAILRQSQPRISRHLRLIVDAGLVDRFREGSWAFFRLAERGGIAELARGPHCQLDPADTTLARDRERLAGVRAQRAAAAQDYFRRHAAEWDRIRNLHVAGRSGRGSYRRCAFRTRPFAHCLISDRHWTHARTVWSAYRARPWPRSVPRHAGVCARAARSLGFAQLQRAAGRHLRSRHCRDDSFDACSSIRCCIFSMTARARSSRRRACCVRAAVCWWWILLRMISNFCATSTPTAGWVLRPRRWRNG